MDRTEMKKHPVGDPTRRRFLRAMAAGAAAVSGLTGTRLSAAAREAPPSSPPLTNRKLVLVNIEGGYDALSMLPPLTGTAAGRYLQVRPLLAVRPAIIGQPVPLVEPIALPGVSAFGLHPSLGPLAQEFGLGRMAIVQKVGLPVPQLSHFKARDIMAIGRADIAPGPQSGWLGRTAALNGFLNTQVMGIGVTGGMTFNTPAGAPGRPAVIGALSSFELNIFIATAETQQRRTVLTGMLSQSFPGENRINAALRPIIANGGSLASLLSTATSGINLAGNYGDPNGELLARSLPDIAKLIAAPSVPTRIFYTSTGDVDTHAYEEENGPGGKPRLRDRLDAIMQALSAFIADLKSPAINRWNDVAIVLYTEFGRRNFENQSRGTDHGHGFHAIVLGGLVQGGLKGNVVTASDLDPAAPWNHDNLPVEIDYRTVFKKCLEDWLGLDGQAVFDDFIPPAGEPAFDLF